jgi:hypothetical protein
VGLCINSQDTKKNVSYNIITSELYYNNDKDDDDNNNNKNVKKMI